MTQLVLDVQLYYCTQVFLTVHKTGSGCTLVLYTKLVLVVHLYCTQNWFWLYTCTLHLYCSKLVLVVHLYCNVQLTKKGKIGHNVGNRLFWHVFRRKNGQQNIKNHFGSKIRKYPKWQFVAQKMENKQNKFLMVLAVHLYLYNWLSLYNCTVH